MSEKKHTFNFQYFWPRYLEAHRHPYTRLLHYIATILGLSSAALALIKIDVLFILIGIPISYAIALGAHHWVEKRPSLIGVNAILGARADLYMCWLGLTGQLLTEYRRFGLDEPKALFTFPRTEGTTKALTSSGVSAAIAQLGDNRDC